MRKNKLFTITIICLGLVTACTDQGNDNLKGNKSAIEDTGNSEIEEKADAADSKKPDAVLDSPLRNCTHLMTTKKIRTQAKLWQMKKMEKMKKMNKLVE